MKIENFSNYEIYPNDGKILSLRRNKFIGCKDKEGYVKCTLIADDGTKWKTNLHRVIWTACNGEISQGMQVNHIDENPSNNCISNLNLMSCKENCNWGKHNDKMSKSMKGNMHKKGKNNNKSSKQVGAYKDGELIMVFPSTREAGRNGFHQSGVSACCNGKLQYYKNLQWQYL